MIHVHTAHETPTERYLSQLDTANLRDRAKQSIRASIVAGEIEAGRVYPVSYFADKLGVSATPIREALVDLASVGLVELLRNRGFRVPEMTEADLDELFEIRMLLERPAVVKVTRQRLLRDTTAFRELASQMVEYAASGDVAAFLAADRAFHTQLVRESGNARLADIVTVVRDQARLYGLRSLAEAGQLVDSAKMHLDLLTAVEAGNGEVADELMRRHLEHTRGSWARDTHK
jgi:DNA-binding GntR family transcriptional regulator